MIILDKYKNKAIIYRKDDVCHFVVARLKDNNSNIGDKIISYKGGDNHYFQNLNEAVLFLYEY
jgi:hypothetical protein